MKMTRTKNLITAVIASALTFTMSVKAAEIGHYAPGIANIRDFVLPPPGFYAAWYNYKYTTDQLNDAHGDKITSININPGGGPGVTLGVDVDIDLYATSPMFIWVSNCEILGAKYAAYIAPSFATSSVSASLSTLTGRGFSKGTTSNFGEGDLFVQPIWLGFALTHWEFALGYGFYAPVGRYHTEMVSLPAVGLIKTEAVDNIGLGFWTHQIQGAMTWYPWAHKATALAVAMTYEVHGKKKDFDLTAGQNLTLNWGISQYLPLNKANTLLLELGPTGYCSWQISKDSGNDAVCPRVCDEVHAVGAQLGITYLPLVLAVNFHGFHEFAAKDRFQGNSFGLNIVKKF